MAKNKKLKHLGFNAKARRGQAMKSNQEKVSTNKESNLVDNDANTSFLLPGQTGPKQTMLEDYVDPKLEKMNSKKRKRFGNFSSLICPFC